MLSRLTVIIPVYNGMPFLPAAVESILSQAYQYFQLLIIDDGSTDDSLQYLQSLTDPRVRIHRQHNLGLCESLNRAIACVDSEFIARLDQDDIALPSRLQEQMDFFYEHPDYICLLSNISRISSTDKDFGHYNINCSETVSNYDPKNYGCIVHSTICFRREAFLNIGGYRSFVYPVDDFDLLLRFWEYGRVAVINKPLVQYRIHSNAGTFRVFREMQVKTRYVLAMSQRRQIGQPEISVPEFIQTFDRTSIWQQLLRYINESGMLLFRKAGLLVGEEKLILGMLSLFAALVLNPRFAIKRLFSIDRSNS